MRFEKFMLNNSGTTYIGLHNNNNRFLGVHLYDYFFNLNFYFSFKLTVYL